MNPKRFLSCSLDLLVDPLIEELESRKDPMQTQTILVPNGQTKQWLQIEIAKRQGIAMGLNILQPEQLFPSSQSLLKRVCSLYTALGESKEPELLDYIDGKKKRQFELATELSSLFIKYERHGLLFDINQDWQTKLFSAQNTYQKIEITDPIICFGLDYLPHLFWELLFKAPALSIYQFSPCREFWEDICSDRERKKLSRYWENKGARQDQIEQLEDYLQESPKLLANWGMLARATFKEFEDFQIEDIYPLIEPRNLLTQIQSDLLDFKNTENPKNDGSIQVLQIGSSKLAEIEALKEAILSLDLPYSEISVLAPDIAPYAPLIEYVFGDTIPFRISGIDSSGQSSYKQGLTRLLNLGRWEAKDLLALFETPSFYRKRNWDTERLDTFRSWIEKVKIGWGIDATHRKEILEETISSVFEPIDHSWEKGLDDLLDALIFLKPMQIDADTLEELVCVFFSLKDLQLNGEKTLYEWADIIQKGLDTCLLANSEEDGIFHNHVKNLLLEMRKTGDSNRFPLDIVKHFLLGPLYGGMHGSKLHAVRFDRLDETTIFPARALFLIGMDEMSFPRNQAPSSIDLLKGKIPSQGDFDRYAFLKALFSAKEILHISYGHLSVDEGKPIGPSLLVQELIELIGPSVVKRYQPMARKEIPKKLHFPNFSKTFLPEGEITLSFQDLRSLARHPWKFFLQTKYKIFLNEELEDSFALIKGKLIRDFSETSAVELPGSFKTAMQQDISAKINERKAQLKKWEIEPFSLILRKKESSVSWEGPNAIGPALELVWDKCKVTLVGEIKMASTKGLISLGEDNIGGTLKIWPEALAVAAFFKSPQIYMIRNGKTRPLSNPFEQLKSFIEYYFHCLQSPSPLLPEWADSILRKNDFSNLRSRYQDPVMDWVSARAELPEISPWAPLLQTTFQGLIDLYPTMKRSS